MNIEEWAHFFHDFPQLHLFRVASVVAKGKEEMEISEFLSIMTKFITEIESRSDIDIDPYRIPFSCALSPTISDFSVMHLPGERVLVKPREPVIQLRPLSLSMSPEGALQTKSWGKDNIFWGIQLSYPQIFQDPQTKEIVQALADHPNGKLFKEILKWFRLHTKPVSLAKRGKSLAFSLKVGAKSVYLLAKHEQIKKSIIEFVV
jgi:hypothetical protein